MFLDDIQTFIDQYHVLGWGVGLLIVVFLIVFMCTDVNGKWFTGKDRNKKIT